MRLLRVSESTTDYQFSLPSQGDSLIVIEFPDRHYEWVKLCFTEWRRQELSAVVSNSTSIACCQDGPAMEAVNDALNRLHNSRFGSGGWLKPQRLRLPVLSGETECVDREQDALSALRNHELKAALQEYKILSEVDQTRPESTDSQDQRKPKKRPGDERLTAVGKLSRTVKRLRAVADPTDKDKLDKISSEISEWKCLEYLVSEVKKGIRDSQHPPRTVGEGTLRPFAALVEYRRTQGKDCGEYLRSVLDGLATEGNCL